MTKCKMNGEDKMGAKGKLSVTVDREILEALDMVSRRFHVAKSRVAEEALRLWLKKRTEKLLAEGYEAMAAEDKEFAEIAFQAQRETV